MTEQKTEQQTRTPVSGYRTDISGLISILPADERHAVKTAWEGAQTREHRDCILALVYAMRRAELRRRNDRAGDRKRRRIVGARLPREIAELCKCAANDSNMSLNKWCANLLVKALASTPYRLGADQEVRYVRPVWEDDETSGYWC